jgi:hypothetical protein
MGAWLRCSTYHLLYGAKMRNFRFDVCARRLVQLVRRLTGSTGLRWHAREIFSEKVFLQPILRHPFTAESNADVLISLVVFLAPGNGFAPFVTFKCRD